MSVQRSGQVALIGCIAGFALLCGSVSSVDASDGSPGEQPSAAPSGEAPGDVKAPDPKATPPATPAPAAAAGAPTVEPAAEADATADTKDDTAPAAKAKTPEAAADAPADTKDDTAPAAKAKAPKAAAAGADATAETAPAAKAKTPAATAPSTKRALPSGHPPMGGLPPGHPTTKRPTHHHGRREASVVVSHVSPTGVVASAGGTALTLELRRAPDRPMARPEPELVAGWTATTNANGRASFDMAGAGPTDEAAIYATYQGVRYDAPRFEAGRPVEIRVYERTVEREALTLSYQAEVSFGEGAMMVNSVIRLENNSLTTIDTDVATALRLPMLAPSAFGLPLMHGLLPPAPDSNHFRIELEVPLGRVAVERGAPYFRGPILPGKGQIIRIRYSIPYVESPKHALALVSDHKLASVVVAGRYPTAIAPRFRPRRPATPLRRQLSEGWEVYWTIDEPLKAGDPLFIDIESAPERNSLYHPLAIAGAIIGLLCFFLVLATTRRQAPVQVADVG